MGAYLYIRGQDAHKSTWVAIIQSQKIDLNETTNLTFWYHMNGNGIGTLSLYMVTSDNVTSNNESNMLWIRSGRQSPDWLEATVSLQPSVFQLQFRATTRNHFASDIGLDDVWLQSEPKGVIVSFLIILE
ncbi:hypothetical protein CHS0354_038291 [Potamilus streckersoni]|uniref:MAM domain-containing protein n=1 Tax=Potamilus streckersoni TaxID=2493646 RepID=A0AAE0WBV8_9BIVA|nr:hypothetical protein CHS0354_038291 [Potamilus streckersoni]